MKNLDPILNSGRETIRQNNERLILDAAEKIFACHGFKGSSTMQIAKEANLPKANVHYYFKTKSDLYSRVLENTLQDWMSAASLFKTHEDPAVTLSNYIAAKMDLARNRPYGSRVWAKEIMSGASVIQKEMNSTLKNWVDECSKTIDDWVKTEKIKPVNAKALLYMIWATTQHYADFEFQITALNDNKPLSDEEFEDKKKQVIELILSGLGLR